MRIKKLNLVRIRKSKQIPVNSSRLSAGNNNRGISNSGICPATTAAAASQSGNGWGNRYFITAITDILLTG
ncbi:hypothetical protein TUM12151_13890 [Morganella morganii]|nr:hypothetical protein TUM12149_10410 [Morganella morganii]GIZ29738.1 hypothetical protein TUM12150_02240 [Morganella morganii]GIZ34403.1 hypothetical protein TUM12151_13890 [Morganella morganii]